MAILNKIFVRLFAINISICIVYGGGDVKLENNPDVFVQLYENGFTMLQNDIAKRTVVSFLNDAQVILDDKTAGQIITGVSATIKYVLQHEYGSESIKAISDGLTDLLTDANCHNSIKTFVEASKDVFGNANTVEFFELLSKTIDELLEVDQLPTVIDILGSGFKSILAQPKIDSMLDQTFNNLIVLSGGQVPKPVA